MTCVKTDKKGVCHTLTHDITTFMSFNNLAKSQKSAKKLHKMLSLGKGERKMVLDLTKNQTSPEYWAKRQESIERQSAAKSTAILLNGTNPTPETIRLYFDVFLKLIKGD